MRRVLPALLVLAAVTGCAQETAVEPSYDLVEFAVDGPTAIEVGTGSVTVTNSGEFAHTLVITDGDGAVAAATALIQPGEAAELSLDLAPGVYSFTCRIVAQTPDGDIVDHFEAGMLATVSVTG